jgi:cell division control protein 24
VILQGLQSLISNFASVKAQHAALIGIDQVVTILTDGVLLFSELQSELRSLPPRDEGEGKISLRARMQWARKEGSFNTFITRLQSFKTSMTLVLMILKRYVAGNVHTN